MFQYWIRRLYRAAGHDLCHDGLYEARVHEPWKESFSGRKVQRPAFAEVLAFLDESPGRVQYYLFRSIDRFTRGGSFAYEQMKRELAKRGVEMVDSNGMIQPVQNTLEDLGFEYDWSRSSPSEIAEIVTAASAKQEATSILTRLIGQEIRLTQRGYKIGAERDGYTNAKVVVDGRKRTIEVPHPERAKYIVAMFELRASGQYSDLEICERVNAMGYLTPVRNRWNRAHQEIIGRTGGTPLPTSTRLTITGANRPAVTHCPRTDAPNLNSLRHSVRSRFSDKPFAVAATLNAD